MSMGTFGEGSVILDKTAQHFSSLVTKYKNRDSFKSSKCETEPQYTSYVIHIIITIVKNKTCACTKKKKKEREGNDLSHSQHVIFLSSLSSLWVGFVNSVIKL